MPQQFGVTTVTMSLLLAGGTLAAVGALRLSGLALRRMPMPLAVAVVLCGAAVGASGFVLRVPPPRPTTRASPVVASPAPTVTNGSIEGTVRVAGGAPVANAGVTLHRFERTDEVETRTAATGPDGSFAFSRLPVAHAVAYTVTTDFAGTTFRSGLVLLDADAPARTVDLTVAPTIGDASVVSVDVDSTVLVGEGRGVEVVQILSVRNSSDRAFVGGLRMPLLPRASGLDPRKGLDRTRLSLESGDLVSSAPVLPGKTEILYTYTAPISGRGLVARRTFHYPTDRFALLVGDKLDADAPRLRAAGHVRLGKKRYESFRTGGLAPGATVKATVRPERQLDKVRVAIVAGGVALALGAVVYPLARRRP